MEGSTKHLVPSTLGIGLVEGYNKIDFERSLSKPQLRREVRVLVLRRFLPINLPMEDGMEHGPGLRGSEDEE
jgi:hypothetical protein